MMVGLVTAILHKQEARRGWRIFTERNCQLSVLNRTIFQECGQKDIIDFKKNWKTITKETSKNVLEERKQEMEVSDTKLNGE